MCGPLPGIHQRDAVSHELLHAEPLCHAPELSGRQRQHQLQRLTDSGGKSLSHGLFFDVGYTWSKAPGTIQNATNSQPATQWYTLRNGNLTYGPIPFDHRHTLTAFWTY